MRVTRSGSCDLKSFFWVAVWSIFFNKGDTGTKSVEEHDIWDCLARGHRDEAVRILSILSDDGGHRNITQRPKTGRRF